MKQIYNVLTILLLLICSGTASAWLSGSDHRMAITVNNGGASTLNYYQFNLTNDTNVLVAAGHMQASGADCRITDSSDNLIPFWNETAFNAAGTKIWANATTLAVGDNTFYMYYGNTGASSVMDIGSMAYKLGDDFGVAVDYYKFSVDSTNHSDYGLAYPVTYKFSIPSGSANLEAYKKFTVSAAWVQITEHTSSDFFNGIEAVRFDYANNFAFVSIAFDASYNDIFIKIVDASNDPVATYAGITEYYDDRDAVVTSTVDDYGHYSGWAGCSSYSAANWDTLKGCSNTFAEHKVWYSGGIDINHSTYPESVNWTILQEYLIDPGYGEAASHSWKHIGCPYDNYNREMNQSKLAIISNLTLPYAKGSDEYVYLWIEPGGQTCNRSFLGECKYLVDRSVVDDQNTWASWDATNGLYNRIGRSLEMGECGTENLATLNAKFDSVTGARNIYHLVAHHQCVNWANGGYADQHLNYISNKTNMWYVGFGYMYLYHYVQERGIVTAKAYNDGSEITLTSGGLDSSKWSEELHGTGTSISVVDGECKLYVPDDQICSASIKSVSTFTNGVAIELKRKCPTDDEYIELSLGSGTVCDIQGGTTEWWHTTLHSSYMFYMSNTDADSALVTYIPPTGAKTYLTTWTYTSDDANNYHNWTYIYNPSGSLEWYEDDVLKTSTIHNSYLIDNKNILITQGAYSQGGRGAPSFLDWVFVRKYTATDPTSSLGVEEDASTGIIYLPPDPINVGNTTGDDWIKHLWTAGSGNITDSYNVSVNTVWHNTSPAYYNNTGLLAHAWSNITVYAYNSSSTGTLSSGSISQNTQVSSTPSKYIPPDPINIINNTGSDWIKHLWDVGTGNVTDSYNVCVNNIWYNGTINTYYQKTYTSDAWQNITVFAYNNSAGGTLSLSGISQNTFLEYTGTQYFFKLKTMITEIIPLLSNVLLLVIAYVPVLIGIMMVGVIVSICIGVFGKLKRW